MTYAKLEKLMKKNGWYYHATIGSHIQYKHNSINGTITIPSHRREAKLSSLNRILNLLNIFHSK